MENFEFLKSKLIRTISESSDRNLILKLWELITAENVTSVTETQSIYESEKPMTEEEVEEYFREEEIVLPEAVLKMIEKGLDDVKNGRVIDNEEVEKYFEEWLED
ncbi:hypothetical protein [Chryseobacterium sp. MDT2-18]|uniref:hypothetical protein n=1 Tax=Chryseobacterium sp. MDT2-18 TaxID=1259136 RepID=UPI00277DC672|nr:hypothetical protein [Chryseobacterium sp. MDT2-18]MDQ0475644.1 putative transcriptional regulator [Chryseobacterium sp. MDT2-18]